jgi:hypothetical protein
MDHITVARVIKRLGAQCLIAPFNQAGCIYTLARRPFRNFREPSALSFSWIVARLGRAAHGTWMSRSTGRSKVYPGRRSVSVRGGPCCLR